jgi:hypothetical protein
MMGVSLFYKQSNTTCNTIKLRNKVKRRLPLRGGRGFSYAASPARGFPYGTLREFFV